MLAAVVKVRRKTLKLFQRPRKLSAAVPEPKFLPERRSPINCLYHILARTVVVSLFHHYCLARALISSPLLHFRFSRLWVRWMHLQTFVQAL